MEEMDSVYLDRIQTATTSHNHYMEIKLDGENVIIRPDTDDLNAEQYVFKRSNVRDVFMRLISNQKDY